jgi:glycogen synthase
VNVLLVGDYPPPYGGISVQVQALQRWIEQESELSCTVLNIGVSRREPISGCLGTPSFWIFVSTLWKYARQGYILHIVTNGHNTKSWLCAFACSVAGILNRRRTIIALDSGAMPEFVQEAGWFLRMLMRVTLQLAGKVICRNNRGQDALFNIGNKDSSVLIIPGYIPSIPSNPEAIPAEMKTFLAAHAPVIGTVVAFRPEYGVDLLVDAVNQLAIDWPNLGLIIVASGDEPNTARVIRGLQQNGRVAVIKDLPHPICLAVMSRLTLFARCTYYDGDAISVREALALGLPVVASDTDYRPEGVTLFTKGDVKDLVKKLRCNLEKSGELSVNSSRCAMPNTADRVLNLYHELAAGRSIGKKLSALRS